MSCFLLFFPDQTGRKIVKMLKTFNGFCRKTV